MLGKVLIFVSFFISLKRSTFDNVPMIALWMPNYSVITRGFVILFRVAKSEFNISRCCFSVLVVFFLLLWQCFLDFWLKKLNFESICIHASFSFRPLCRDGEKSAWELLSWRNNTALNAGLWTWFSIIGKDEEFILSVLFAFRTPLHWKKNLYLMLKNF